MKRVKIIFLLIILYFCILPLFSQSLLSFEKLDGDWDFYLQKTPSQVFSGVQKDSTIYVPGNWNKKIQELTGSSDPKTYGCFRYTKKNLKAGQKYAILIKSAPATSCEVYINGESLAKNGNPFAKVYNPQNKNGNSVSKQLYCEFYCNQNNEADILIFVSNYFYRKSGLWDSIIFGEQKDIKRINTVVLFFVTFLVGIFLFTTLINLIQFHFDRNKKTFFHLSILSMACILRIMTAEYCSLGFLFPNMSAEIKYKLEYMIMWVAPIAVLKNICYLYPVKTKIIIFSWFKEIYLRRTVIFLD